jgi:serine/threonine-protein kinase
VLERVAHFTILAKLGQGGMGVVFKAHDTKLRRNVALKLLPPEHVGDAERRTRFLREARSAAAVTHANIATIYEIGEDEAGRIFISMELVEGQSVRDVLVAKGSLDVHDALRIGRAIARGLAKAHELGLVHRDLKPDNVMLGSEGEVKILDFGLAKQRETVAASKSILENAETGKLEPSHITEAGVVLGTPGYMSPEQATGRPVDERSDVFSLGVMLYEMLAGTLPFRGSTFGELVVAVARDEPRSLTELAPSVPASVAAVVVRCLHKSPEERFASGHALMQAIDDSEKAAAVIAEGATERAVVPKELVVDSRRTTAPPPPESAPPSRRGGTRVFRPAAVAIVGLALVLVLAVGRWRTTHIEATTADASTDAGPTGLLSAPPPAHCNDASRAHYRAGLEASRSRGVEYSYRHFEEATKADPSCAEAHLRAALHAQWGPGASGHYSQAATLRGQLSEPDQALLDAYAPYFTKSPPDWTETLSRDLELLRHRPRDAEVMILASYLLWANDPEEQMAALGQRAIDVDPGFSSAWQVLGVAQLKAGRYDDARKTYETCEKTIPSAVDCVFEEANLAQLMGRCGEMEVSVRSLLARTAGRKNSYSLLATALASNDAGRVAVEEALRQYGADNDALDPQSLALSEAHLAMAYGDFEAADRALARVESLLQHSEKVADHAAYAQQVFELRLETGQVDAAIKAAETFAARQRAWPGTIAEFYGSNEEGTLLLPRMLSVQLHMGKITAERRDAMMAGWLPKTTMKGDDRAAWILRDVALVETPEEARRALAVMPAEDAAAMRQYAPTRSFQSALVGRVLVLGGRVEDGIAELRRATSRCDLLEQPMAQLQAHLWLGEALAAAGHEEPACDELGFVLERWQNARPASRSARRAADLRRSLKCAK